MLALENEEVIQSAVLTKLKELARQGAVIVVKNQIKLQRL